MEIIKQERLKSFIGSSKEILSLIKDLNYGILIVNKDECRGIDIRFNKDALVLITSNV
jgi:hypothetical protein